MNPDQLERGNGSLGLFRVLVTNNFEHKLFWQYLFAQLLPNSDLINSSIIGAAPNERLAIVLRDAVERELNALREPTESRVEEL